MKYIVSEESRNFDYYEVEADSEKAAIDMVVNAEVEITYSDFNTTEVKAREVDSFTMAYREEKRKRENWIAAFMNCYCDEPDHEMCWDGLITQSDPKCGCCQQTIKRENDDEL